MSYITTVSGIHIDPKIAAESEIEIRDICHSLSLLCRANGHVKYFFSVAQHSVNCCMEAKERGYSDRVQLACLLHDAAECYLSDVTRPIKQDLPEYCRTEETLLHLIWEKYLGEPLTAEEEKLVFAIDDDMLSYEFFYMMPESLSDDYQKIVSKPELEFQMMDKVEERMLEIFWGLKEKLSGGKDL